LVVRHDLAPTSVVNEEIKPAPSFFHGLHHASHVPVGRHVGLPRDRLPALLSNVGGDPFSFALRDAIIHENFRAFRCQALRDGAAHARSRPGDNRNTVFQFHDFLKSKAPAAYPSDSLPPLRSEPGMSHVT
jgi:hypothetical protein